MKTQSLIQTAFALAVSVFFLPAGLFMSWAAPADVPAPRGFVGIRCQEDNGWLAVGGVAENSPASRAGLLGGERILKINGRETKDKPIRESAQWLVGPVGEKVILTLIRPNQSNAQPFEITLVRAPYPSRPAAARETLRAVKADWSHPPTREAGLVEWKGDKIVSRVMPYRDFISLFIRLPIAHAAALGQGVQVGVIQFSENDDAQILIQNVSPRASVSTSRCHTNDTRSSFWMPVITGKGWKIVLIGEPAMWPAAELIALTEQLVAKDILVIVPSDLSEDSTVIASINNIAKAGGLTVGRVDRQSLLLRSIEGGEGDLPFNKNIREIQTDVFSTVGVDRNIPAVAAAATAAGVAALVLEKWPQISAPAVRQKIITGARSVWQMVGQTTPIREIPFTINPVTTEIKAKPGSAVFNFRALDAAGSLGVDTEIPWFLNMMNCEKAWAITRGQGIRAVITDQGFHLRHPALIHSIASTQYFGPMSFDAPDQNFHGTDMSRIFLAIAPEARIVPVLCSGQGREELVGNIAKSFRYAAELKADVISGSWAGWFNNDENLLKSVREAVDNGVVASWFHYPKPYPGLLRSSFTYAGGWGTEPCLGFIDRFVTDPPGFHPAEIEAGLSATAPQAAGIAALAKSVNAKLTPKQVEALIIKHSTSIGGGVLIPDAWRIVRAAKEERL